MYNKHLVVKPNKTGVGVFTTVEIPAGEPIIEVTGQVYTEEKLPDPNDPALIQIGPNIFIGPSGTIDDFIGHSCSPNCLLRAVGNRAIIYSMYVIRANTEITFDYSTSSTDTLDKWQMNCNCGAFNCRRVISGYQYLDENLKEEYKKRGMIPLFLTNPIFLKRY
jgi:hypothetical protein